MTDPELEQAVHDPAPTQPLPMLVLFALTALCGCRSTAPSTYHVLQPPEASALTPGGDERAGLVSLSVLRFPGYLKRVQLVSERKPGTLELSETHAWAEPLEEGFARVLAEDLAGRLGRPVALAGALTRPPRTELAIELEVARFDVRASGVAELAVTWMAAGGDGRTLAEPRRAQVTVPLEGNGAAASVAALSAAVAQLASRMAADLEGAR